MQAVLSQVVENPEPTPPPPPIVQPLIAQDIKEECPEELPPPPTSISVETNNNNNCLSDCQVVDLQADMPSAGVGGVGGTGDTSDLLTELYDDVMQCVYDDVASTGGDLDIFAAAAAGDPTAGAVT